MTVSGTAATAGPTGNAVVVYLVGGQAFLGGGAAVEKSDPIPVAADGSFSVDVDAPTFNARVVAVPDSPDADADAERAAFEGTGPFRSSLVLGGAAVTEVFGPGSENVRFQALRGQRRGYAMIAPTGSSFFSFSDLAGITSGTIGPSGLDGGVTFLASSSLSTHYNDARGGVMVDGVRGYLRDQIPLENSDQIPEPRLTRAVDPETGGQKVVVSQLLFVAADPDDDPNDEPLPGGYRPSGVEHERTVVQDHDGLQVTVTDVFRSTDGAAHAIDLLYSEGFGVPYDGRTDPCSMACTVSGPASALALAGTAGSPASPLDGPGPMPFELPAYRIPWESGDRWVQRSHAEPLSAPPATPTTIYTRLPDFLALSGSGTGPVDSVFGAITFASGPDGGVFVADPYGFGPLWMGATSQFVARFVRDVPRDGAATITKVYSVGSSSAEVDELATDAQQRLTPPKPIDPPVGPPILPIGPPAPPILPIAPPVDGPRQTPRRLSATASRQRTRRGAYRLRFRGRLSLPAGVSRTACRKGGGVVSVQVKAGRKTISSRRYRLDAKCRYSAGVTFRSAKRFAGRKRLTVIVRWTGNRSLAAKRAKRFTVRVR